MNNRKRALYYVFFSNDDMGRGYVVCTYSDFSTRVWYEGERGYKQAKGRAIK